VIVSGTFRTFNEEWRETAHARIRDVAQGVATGFGAQCIVQIDKGYPSLHNDRLLTLRCKQAAAEYLGTDNVHDIPPRLTAEDFAYYAREIPACFYRLGVGNPGKGITASVHTPIFDIDESALSVGAGLMAWLAITELSA
jgi:metal-dependent amidase/aminoacylase/carboxypeptidase family protein